MRHFPSTMRMAASGLAVLTLYAYAAACSRSGASTDPSHTSVQQTPIGATLGQPFDLKFGQSATVAGTDFRFTFARVAGDSRCPTDVQCVWAGDAEIAVSFSRGGGASIGTAELHTNPTASGLREVDLDGHYVIRLETIAPAPHSGRTIPQGDYVATLLVREKYGLQEL